MTPVQAIRAKCIDCSAGERGEVKNCTMKDCPLYPYRMGKRPKVAGSTPMKAIRRHCLDCCNGQSNEVRLCPSKWCPVWELRSGHKPQ